ncbi:MAG: hypothetical protein HY290_03690, partial [Planctomycetia bacterium]|nr:hypothetical protein [Planctomycetia bacterium]
MSAVINSFRHVLSAPYHWWLDKSERAGLATRLARSRAALQRYREAPNVPRIAVVKQDVNEDLYCCPRGSSPREIVESTLLRSGPVCLFSEWNSDFLIVTTTDDPECSIWQERATHLKWDTLEFYRSYRDRVPGRDYGQSRLAIDPASVDWSAYDIVISIDAAVPERVTRKFPQTRWCYYVREVKAPAYAAALERPHAGQDFVLNHHFRMRPVRARDHVIEFPYHLQSPGCFHRLFGLPEPDTSERRGVFVDHHTMLGLSKNERSAVAQFGPLSSVAPENGLLIPTSVQLARRTMEPEFRSRLLASRYFQITPG